MDDAARAAIGPYDGGPLDPRTANLLYHDAAARSYDAKWAISFDDRCVAYVRDRAERMLPERRYGRVLEVGCGTGFFLLNLWQAGFVERPFACDLSPGMLAACARSARRIGCDPELRTADAERLPYEDGSFDLVVGHAFLHHVPDPARALAEAYRVLAPGGTLFVAGEPTRAGDAIATRTGRITYRAYRAAARAVPRLRRPPPGEAPLDGDARILRDLEWAVDLHTFEPDELADLARSLGFEDVRIETEELASSVAGWAVRTVEAEAPPGLLGAGWGTFAYRMYLALFALDRRVLSHVVPARIFHHLLLAGRKP